MREGQKTVQARRLRSNMTEGEQRLWQCLRMKQLAGHRFRRQHPVGPYIVDFACIDAKLIVEADGGQHAESDGDMVRDAFLQRQGFAVLRFWNNDVMQSIDGVLEVIMQRLDRIHPHPDLPPLAGEGAKRLSGEVVGGVSDEGFGATTP